jgi:hypothetical protein
MLHPKSTLRLDSRRMKLAQGCAERHPLVPPLKAGPEAVGRVKSREPVEKLIFFRLIKNTPASVPQGGATCRQADAS